ncbi:MAG: MFS transporter [Solirubrobacterales bacterium]
MSATSQAATERSAGRSGRRALLALGAADAAFAFQQTAVIPALPTIERELESTAQASAYLLSAYLVLASVATPLLGKLADRYGKRRLIVGALGCFLTGSIGAALAPTIETLIGFRALQGIGGAVFPLTQSMVRDELPDDGVGSGMGWLTGAFGIGAVAGLGSSGLLIEIASWRLIFVVGAVVTLLAALSVGRFVARSTVRNDRRLDLPGAILLAGGLGALIIGITEAERVGPGEPGVIGLLLGSVVLLGGWVWHEIRTPEPLVELAALTARPVLYANLATAMLGFALFGVLFLVPHLAETPASGATAGFGLGLTPIQSGLLLVPNAFGQLLGGPVAGWLESRHGARLPLAAGMALMVAGSVALVALHDSAWQLAAGAALVGVGIGFVLGPAASIVARGVRSTETGISTALNAVARRVAGAVGSQLAAVALAVFAVGGTPTETGYVVGFAVCAVVAGIGTVLALRIPQPAGTTA